MIPFLKQVAQSVHADPALSRTTFVFPNKRSPLFFRQYLSEYITRPVWMPAMTSIQSFFESLSALKQPDHLILLYRLYKAYRDIMHTEDPFHRFYFWGNMLLRDFDEIDKSLVDASQLFRDLSRLKELDEHFDFMPEEQRRFLERFWQNVGREPMEAKKRFLRLWRKLFQLYTRYRQSLLKEGLGYEGMCQRQAVDPENLSAHALSSVAFVGFNVLTRVEERLIAHCIRQGARIWWDTDAYYMDTPEQEAGYFLRQHRKKHVFSSTFAEPPTYISQRTEKITIMGASQPVGQARLLGEQIKDLYASSPQPGRTVVVLPDENMLLPALYALPKNCPTANVTMGYPIRQTPIYTLLDAAMAMQMRQRDGAFYHRTVVDALAHTYLADFSEAKAFCEDIAARNRIYISAEDLQTNNRLLKRLFRVAEPAEAPTYLLDIVKELQETPALNHPIDRESVSHMRRRLEEIEQLFREENPPLTWSEWHELFRQLLRVEQTPFGGDSLGPLQVMGMLETRNLDFDHVHILSLNEGTVPFSPHRGSHLPYRVRKAYRMPTHDHQEAMSAYLFYRLLQRSKTVSIYYVTEVDEYGAGEMSRFVKQLLYESPIPHTHHTLRQSMRLPSVAPVTVHKTANVKKRLLDYIADNGSASRMLTPSALNDYLDCRLRFYLKHMVRLRETEEVEETPDARLFGNVLHDAMQTLYESLSQRKNGVVDAEDLVYTDADVQRIVTQSLKKQYPAEKTARRLTRGPHVLTRALVGEFIKKIIEQDKAYAPFTVLALEKKFSLVFSVDDTPLVLGGYIDRIDKKGDTCRIIDYKTGKDELRVADLSSLFTREGKRNKAAFQTFFYTYIYARQPDSPDARMKPGLMNRKNLFDDNFVFGHPLGKGKGASASVPEDVRPLLETFERHLYDTLKELYNEGIPFDQTEDHKNCVSCPYREICRR